jgi:hypothetical protein
VNAESCLLVPVSINYAKYKAIVCDLLVFRRPCVRGVSADCVTGLILFIGSLLQIIQVALIREQTAARNCLPNRVAPVSRCTSNKVPLEVCGD